MAVFAFTRHHDRPDTHTSVLPSCVDPFVPCINYTTGSTTSAGLLHSLELDHSYIPVRSNHCSKALFSNIGLVTFKCFVCASDHRISIFTLILVLSFQTNRWLSILAWIPMTRTIKVIMLCICHQLNANADEPQRIRTARLNRRQTERIPVGSDTWVESLQTSTTCKYQR